MNFNNPYLYVGIAILLAIVAYYFLFPRRSKREGFQTPSTPADMIGDKETCNILKNII
jgi:hypothetical protein